MLAKQDTWGTRTFIPQILKSELPCRAVRSPQPQLSHQWLTVLNSWGGGGGGKRRALDKKRLVLGKVKALLGKTGLLNVLWV